MRLTENRRLGAAAIALCALISVFGIGGAKLSGKYNDLEKTFIYGTETQLSIRHSMDAYLDRCAETAMDLAQEAKRFVPESAYIAETLELVEKINRTNGMQGRYNDYIALANATENLYSELQAAGSADDAAINKAWGNFSSAQDQLKRDGYHAAAAEYNELLDGFPANMVSGLWGLDEAEGYGW